MRKNLCYGWIADRAAVRWTGLRSAEAGGRPLPNSRNETASGQGGSQSLPCRKRKGQKGQFRRRGGRPTALLGKSNLFTVKPLTPPCDSCHGVARNCRRTARGKNHSRCEGTRANLSHAGVVLSAAPGTL